MPNEPITSDTSDFLREVAERSSADGDQLRTIADLIDAWDAQDRHRMFAEE